MTDGLTKEEKDIEEWLDENEDIIPYANWDLRKRLLKEIISMVEKLGKKKND